MEVYELDPLRDSRWEELTARHPKASAFHTVNFLRALRLTYGYDPVAFTTARPGAELGDGVVFCRVKSWITGNRLVSLPFADHCEPLCDNDLELDSIVAAAIEHSNRNGIHFLEMRPFSGSSVSANQGPLQPGQKYRLHILDLRPTVLEILHGCAKGNVQRRIRHAEKQELFYEEGRHADLVGKFYALMVLTRRRHGTPPPPRAWFVNLVEQMGEKATIRVVSNEKGPIASVLTLAHQGWTTYKYAASDERYKHLAGTVLLVWRSIQVAKEQGAHTFDMGRSDLDNPGLIQFKRNWGAQDLPLVYQQYPRRRSQYWGAWENVRSLGGALIAHLPDPIFIAVGNVLYKHAG